MTTFGDMLEAARKTKGLSQRQLERRLAKVVGDDKAVTGATLGNWERGDTNPRAPQDREILAALETLLEVQPGTFFDALGLVFMPQATLDEREDLVAQAIMQLAAIQAAQTEAVLALQAGQAALLDRQHAGTVALEALVTELRSLRDLGPGERPPARAG